MIGQSVLLVEDNDDIREILADFLEDEGYAVLTADNGQVAFDLLQRGDPPALIILDLMMPVMDGWQLCAKLLEHPILASLPIVVMSARDDVVAVSKRLGAVAAMHKPVRLSKLLGIVEAHCR